MADESQQFDDDEIAKALASFEQELSDIDFDTDALDRAAADRQQEQHADDSAGSKQSGTTNADTSADVDSHNNPHNDFSEQNSDSSSFANLEQGLASDFFEDELQGVLGNVAKRAMIISQITSGKLMAALCRMDDVDAICTDDDHGAVMVLHDLKGQAPEDAATELTHMIDGMQLLLIINRADKIEAHVYERGKSVADVPPPMLMANMPDFVEDYMLAIISEQELRSEGTWYESKTLEFEEAYRIVTGIEDLYGAQPNDDLPQDGKPNDDQSNK